MPKGLEMILKQMFALAMTAVCSIALADVKPVQLFTDNMVIQRDTQAPVWGWAEAGERVTVTGSWGESAAAITDEQGHWKVKLPTPAAGGPHTITLQGKNTIKLKNVLAGDVWLCSGQSNMQWTVANSNQPEEEAAQANYPQIRHFLVARNATTEAAKDCEGTWTVCSPETVLNYSATAYFTGRELHRKLNVPIGLLTSAWGGTRVEAWTPLAEQIDDPFAMQLKTGADQVAKKYSPEKAQATYERQLSAWKQKVVEARAQKKRLPRRPRLALNPRTTQRYPGNLYNGMIHPLLSFAIKGAVWYQGEANGREVALAEHYRVHLARMVQSWRRAWGQEFPLYAVQLPNFRAPQTLPVASQDSWPVVRESFVHVAENTPGVYTCCMIDIGEAGNIHPKNKQDVGRRMASTILNHTYGKETPTTPFMKSFTVEGNEVVVKFAFAGTGLVAKGKTLKGFAIAGADKSFVWANATIEQRDGQDCVVVSSKEVDQPVAVRYAWADNPEGCNLYSHEGFPASPFRTDAWPLSGQE